jgi:proline dehydrogenase
VKGLVVKVVLAVTRWRWVRWIFTSTRPGRRVSLRFVAGETLDQAIAAARTANDAGMPVSLNLLGEHVTDAASAEAIFDQYVAAVDAIASAGVDGNISIKLTQLGLGFDDDLCASLLDRLAAHAAAAGTTVTIDMEDSPFTDVTLDLYEQSQKAHGNLGVAIQAYLRRSVDDLARIIPLGGHVRLCKGAYDEPESIAHRSRPKVNEAYDALMTMLMRDEGVLPALATHDHERVAAAIAIAPERSGPYEFQMLYGIRVSLQEQLVADGIPLRSYIPYGEAWYPYLTRRMAERPANLWFFVRALFGR